MWCSLILWEKTSSATPVAKGSTIVFLSDTDLRKFSELKTDPDIDPFIRGTLGCMGEQWAYERPATGGSILHLVLYEV